MPPPRALPHASPLPCPRPPQPGVASRSSTLRRTTRAAACACLSRCRTPTARCGRWALWCAGAGQAVRSAGWGAAPTPSPLLSTWPNLSRPAVWQRAAVPHRLSAPGLHASPVGAGCGEEWPCHCLRALLRVAQRAEQACRGACSALFHSGWLKQARLPCCASPGCSCHLEDGCAAAP